MNFLVIILRHFAQKHRQVSDRRTMLRHVEHHVAYIATLIGGNRVVMSLAEMLLQLYHHTAYHRGYVGDMMFNVPEHRAPVTDLPVFVREVPQNYY